MTTLSEWARFWSIGDAALRDLQHRMGLLDHMAAAPLAPALSETAVQSAARAESSRLGLRTWRNNVGVLRDERGVPVRYGLANDSPEVNKRIKSADLIGIRPRIIQPTDVGALIGQFVSFECKRSDWRYSEKRHDPHEEAQYNWARLVTSLGGDARFVTGPGQI